MALATTPPFKGNTKGHTTSSFFPFFFGGGGSVLYVATHIHTCEESKGCYGWWVDESTSCLIRSWFLAHRMLPCCRAVRQSSVIYLTCMIVHACVHMRAWVRWGVCMVALVGGQASRAGVAFGCIVCVLNVCLFALALVFGK